MVRRGSKRLTSRETASESPTYARAGNEKSDVSSSRRIRGESPRSSHRKGLRGEPSLTHRRRSRRSNNPWTDNSGDDCSHSSPLPSFSHLPVPSNWTTSSGKFSPKRSELGFDARSNMAINVNSNHGCGESARSGVSEYSPSNRSEEDSMQQKNNKRKGKKKSIAESDTELLDGEIVDPVERHRFYKSLKKAGIKKTFTFDRDWEDSSTSSDVSEISIGNASYILDLAQQKETRKKDREEEALEEALELYGTWLTEGKTDDKNIFLMILHEVKKEQRAKYKKADKRQAALLDAALDEELRRREKMKEEEERDRVKAETEKKEPKIIQVQEHSKPLSPGTKSGRSRKSRNHIKQSQSKISEILEQETSQKILTLKSSQHEANKDDSECSAELIEPIEVIDIAERCTGFGPDGPDGTTPRSNNSRGSKRSGIFSCFGSSLENVMDTSKPKSESNSHSSLINPPKEDSTRMFSRLRKQLSERQAEQWKEEEKSWKKNNHVETKEEQWWKKINDAKKDNALFIQSPATMELTMRTVPNSPGTAKESKKAKLDSTTRTDPGNRRGIARKSSKEEKKASPTESLSTVEEKKKGVPLKKKKNGKADPQLDATEDPKEKKKKKKNEKKPNDSEIVSSTPDNIDEQKYLKKKKKKKEGDEVSADAKDIEEKKKAEGGLQSILVKKKKDKNTKEGSKIGRILGFTDESDSKSVRSGRSSKGRKKKSKDLSGKNSVVEDKKKKKKVINGEEASKDMALLKISKKKKKKTPSSAGSSTENAGRGDDRSMDWTNRCILKTRSETTHGSETVITMDSALQCPS